MTSAGTSIQWDAADYDQVVQNYLSRELHSGRVPFWTPYEWSGYPFLADPQVGAWYPLNWPFFLIGVTPRVLVVEHCLHAMLACFGAYFLAFSLIRHRPAAVLTGLCYGLSGYFVGHSSHTTQLQCAAWMPWLLLLFDRALTSRPLRNTMLGGLAAGMMILAGHFQTILYGFLALGLFALARAANQRGRWLPILAQAIAIPIMGATLSAVATGPGLELAVNSVRASLVATTRTEGLIPLQALTTLVWPNFYGVFSANYHGPYDITQFYIYAGVLLVPLAAAGVWKAGRKRLLLWPCLLLVVPTIWYAMGHSAGLYLLVARLPGFSSVRSPINIWFVPALGLALLAGAGLAAVSEKWPVRWLPMAVLMATALDLFYWNSAANPLAYARSSYQDLYGSKEERFRSSIASNMPPLTRFDAPEFIASFGPMSHFLDLRAEVTYGYGPLALARYHDYVLAMEGNPSLRDGIGVCCWLDLQTGWLHSNPGVLPRAVFPKELIPVRSAEDSRRQLTTLVQSRQALVPESLTVAAQDGGGMAEVRQYAPGHYTIHYKCATASLLRISNSYFPGWRAVASGRRLKVGPVDHALLGIVVPAGEGDLDLDYRSTYFPAGVALSLCALSLCAALLLLEKQRRQAGLRLQGQSTKVAAKAQLHLHCR